MQAMAFRPRLVRHATGVPCRQGTSRLRHSLPGRLPSDELHTGIPAPDEVPSSTPTLAELLDAQPSRKPSLDRLFRKSPRHTEVPSRRHISSSKSDESRALEHSLATKLLESRLLEQALATRLEESRSLKQALETKLLDESISRKQAQDRLVSRVSPSPDEVPATSRPSNPKRDDFASVIIV